MQHLSFSSLSNSPFFGAAIEITTLHLALKSINHISEEIDALLESPGMGNRLSYLEAETEGTEV